MQAIVRTIYGSPDILALRDIDMPSPKDSQVLVKIHAASVNPLDWHLLRGKPFLVRLMGYGLSKPKHQVLGADVAGTIEAVGEKVTQFKVGDEVFGSALGSFAEYACFSEAKLVHKPKAVTFDQAAAVPVAGLTALQGLRLGGIQSGQRVLINGASGGVGTFAVQIAKALGTHVTGVCSERNVEMVRSIGADHVIDYTKAPFWHSGMTFDLILDTAVFYPIYKPMRVLNPIGKYVMIGGSVFEGMLLATILSPFLSKKGKKEVLSMLTKVNQPDLVYLKELLAAGKIRSVIDRTYHLSEVPQAIRYVEQGHARGKVIIRVNA